MQVETMHYSQNIHHRSKHNPPTLNTAFFYGGTYPEGAGNKSFRCLKNIGFTSNGHKKSYFTRLCP